MTERQPDLADPDRFDKLATELVQQAARLSRLAFSLSETGLSRGDADLLSALLDEPRRITELAALQGVAQPAVTRTVNRLETLGFVERRSAQSDGRGVLVALTRLGAEQLEGARLHYRPLMRGVLTNMTEQQLGALASASEAVSLLIDSLARAAQG